MKYGPDEPPLAEDCLRFSGHCSVVGELAPESDTLSRFDLMGRYSL